MAGELKQGERAAELNTPLGKDVLVLKKVDATEGLSELFEYHVDALSADEVTSDQFDNAIGQGCSVKLKTWEDKQRIYHGILTDVRLVGKEHDLFAYRLVLRPWLWLLGCKADCRIFLDKNVKEIIQDVFDKAGFNDYELRTNGSYDKIDYCVQYRETDLAFVSRLMEQYGIYYFFEPSEDKHNLILADSRSSHRPIGDLPKAPFNPLGHTNREQHFKDWTSERHFRTGKVQFNDYDYLKPKKKLLAPKEASEKYTHSKLEVYDYPGKYDEEDKGKKFAQFRLEAEQALDHRRLAIGEAPSLYPGGLVTVEKHPTSSENKEYLIVRASHSFANPQSYRSGESGVAEEHYHGTYDLILSDQPYRSLPVTEKPRIYGIQTAKVVGKKGEDSEEISTDEHGRIWIQFYWDREPQKSCPVRISQMWASNKWGGIFIPRLGMEVVVEFLEGDPDRPLVTGCVYNGDNKVPYDLPDNKTQSGTKSDSSKGHNGYNEFMFEDKKGSEFIRMHAQKDHLVTINQNQTGSVGKIGPEAPSGGDQTWTVGGNRSWTIQKGDDSLEIQLGNQSVKLDVGNQSVQLLLGSQNTQLLLGSQMTSTMTGITDSVAMGLSTIANLPAGVSVTSPMINLTSMAAITITAPTINLLGVVLINGMVPVTIPV